MFEANETSEPLAIKVNFDFSCLFNREIDVLIKKLISRACFCIISYFFEFWISKN